MKRLKKFKKNLIKVFMMAVLCLPLFILFPKVNAEYSIPSLNFTWTGSNPAQYVYVATSSWYTFGINNHEFVIVVPSDEQIDDGTFITYNNTTLGITTSHDINDFRLYDTQKIYFIDISTFANYVDHVDGRFMININYITEVSITSSAEAVSFTESYVGIYSASSVVTTQTTPDQTAYDYGYADGQAHAGYTIITDTDLDGYDDSSFNAGEASVDPIVDDYIDYSGGSVDTAGQDTYDDDSFNAGYNEGHSDGISDAADNHYALTDFVPAILGSTFGFFFQLTSIEVLGISIISILTGFLAIVVVLMIIKMAIK